MGATVAVNGRTVVHKESDGLSSAAPDVCFTPPLAIPTPYVNFAFSKDASDEAASVFADGHPVMIRTSCFGTSIGDEAGSFGGIVSGVNKGKASFSNYSFDVKFEGEPVPRAFDPMVHNHGSPHNAASPAEIQPPDAMDADLIALCAIFCFCNFPGGKMACFKRQLAEPRWGEWMGGIKGLHWDPTVPGVYVEVPYMLKPPPPHALGSTMKSKRLKDKNGRPLPLPAPEIPPVPGSVRPDVVTVKDPRKPPTPDNIKRIYEVKFPPEEEDPEQMRKYKKITGNRAQIINEQTCRCSMPPLPQEQEQEQEDEAPERNKPDEDPWRLPEPDPSPIGIVIAVIARLIERISRTLPTAPLPVPGLPPIMPLPRQPGDPKSPET